MTDSHLGWWMDANCRWHPGRPPPGWRQAANSRWYPPDHEDQTEELEIGPPVGGGAHFAVGDGGGSGETDGTGQRWARLGALISVALVALAGVGALTALSADDPDDEESVAAADVSTTSTVPGSSRPQSAATATPPVTTAEPPTTDAPSQADGTSTTVSTDTGEPPPPSGPPTSEAAARTRAPCSPEGATAIAEGGVPVTCTREKCHGAPYDEPRWRPTTC